MYPGKAYTANDFSLPRDTDSIRGPLRLPRLIEDRPGTGPAQIGLGAGTGSQEGDESGERASARFLMPRLIPTAKRLAGADSTPPQ